MGEMTAQEWMDKADWEGGVADDLHGYMTAPDGEVASSRFLKFAHGSAA